MSGNRVLELPPLPLDFAGDIRPNGAAVLAAILRMAQGAVSALHARSSDGSPVRTAAVGRLRGTGRGIHFRDIVATLEREHPITLTSPFEDSMKVAGAAWDAAAIVGGNAVGALAKLRWDSGADDLPMHVHEHSDRFIIVHEGRGFFHITDETADAFTGASVRSVPARERDVFLFTGGVVHTFSTLDQPMTLLSCQLPYLAFDDPRQYRLPKRIWTARDNPESSVPKAACDPAWTVLAG
jgi:mannose-6-phosphate isomerase-like protein (cupin superfamily)